MINPSLSSAATKVSLIIDEQVHQHGLEYAEGNQLRWPENDPSHPRHWPFCCHHLIRLLHRYMFGQAFGGIIFSPMSESFVIVGTVNDISAVLVGRMLCGLLSAIPTIIAAGSIEDMCVSETRVWMIFAWAVAAVVGLALGPIYSKYITTAIDWRWVFRISAIITFCQAILTIFLRESRPSPILKKRLARLNKQDFITVSLARPTRLFFTDPIVFLITIMASPSTQRHTQILRPLPPQTPQIAAQVIKLEHKIRGFAIGAPLLAIGLWWFAWTVPSAVPAPWPVSLLPLILVGYATNEFNCTLGGYLTDSYTIFSASAYSSMAFLRAALSGAMPLFADQMYGTLGANKATTILAAIATAFCITPILFLKYGEKLRERSAFAKYSREAEKKMSVSRRRQGKGKRKE
ncbi:MFS multidrug transporter [Rhexocercosporidium sp. MPI-PUGE-AT-0058]|nr:MFS multidrug transporter [Rhexocercosporidium sp. MPI-PUGE-AT-0058]